MWEVGQGGWYAKVMEKARELATDEQLERGFDLKMLRDNSEMAYMREEGGTRYRTYFANVKEGYSFEPYLDSLGRLPFLHTLAKLRMGCHNLAVETGRWQRIDRAKRLCQVCHSGAIEDEAHFVYDCIGYEDLRKVFHFILEDRGTKSLRTFLNLEDKIAVGKYLHLCMERRVSVLKA